MHFKITQFCHFHTLTSMSIHNYDFPGLKQNYNLSKYEYYLYYLDNNNSHYSKGKICSLKYLIQEIIN